MWIVFEVSGRVVGDSAPYNWPMLGALITFLFSVGAACFGHLLIRKLTSPLDPALRLGLAGLVGFGAIGTLTLFIGLAPGGLSTAGTWILVFVVAASGALIARSINYEVPLDRPKGAELLVVLGIGVALLFALVSVLAPSDTIEWDSLAYHLAVPKLWLQAGQIQPISFIHHSNFPFAVDNFYIWGLAWGGESGAKAFTLAFHVFGIFAIFGLTRQVYGRLAAWWASLAWTSIPVVMWLSGTGYIDVQNGLYAGLGILFAARFIQLAISPPLQKGTRNQEVATEPNESVTTSNPSNLQSSYPLLAGIMLGLATGSKYTGLQTIFAVAVVFVVAAFLGSRKDPQSAIRNPKSLIIVCGLALVIASPWYVKNVLWVGNPVYPFFYKQLGGKYWSDWQAQIYSNEQQSFGVARQTPPMTRIEAQRIGHAVLGLAYQPGRYINPAETAGMGFPMGAIGFAVIGAMLLWLFSGRAGPFEASALGIVLLSFAMWFVLSEQSRYIIALGVPLSVLAGGAITRLKTGPCLAVAIAIQSLVSSYVVKTMRFDQQIQVVAGKVSREDYLKSTVAFYEPAQYLNSAVGKDGRVALYDEVFGFLLDVPYFWANPGHSNELGYERMSTGEDLVRALRSKGINYVYINAIPAGSNPHDKDLARWLAAMGLSGPTQPYSASEIVDLMPDLNWRAKILLAEAVDKGLLVPDKSFGVKLIYRVR